MIVELPFFGALAFIVLALVHLSACARDRSVRKAVARRIQLLLNAMVARNRSNERPA